MSDIYNKATWWSRIRPRESDDKEWLDYIERLHSMPERVRRKWLEGDWSDENDTHGS